MPRAPVYLLDTNVVLALLRGRELGKAIDQAFALTDGLSRSLICVVTVRELLALAHRLQWGEARRTALESSLRELVWIDINDRAILDTYAAIDAFSLSLGKQVGKNDLWIAAATSVTGATLLTTDADFNHLDPTVLRRIQIDPATGRAP